MTEERVTISQEQAEKSSSWGVDDDHIRRMGEYIYKTVGGRFLYHWMQVCLFFEGVLYALFATLRNHRMKVAERINRNYKRRF